MKTKDKKELHLKSLKELKEQVAVAKDLISNLKLDMTQKKLKNTRQIFIKRKEVAQMSTIIRIKELAQKS
ncbi:MAG: 50S ribosomal protein L29 [Patescibacteria group bacterium]